MGNTSSMLISKHFGSPFHSYKRMLIFINVDSLMMICEYDMMIVDAVVVC